MRCRPGIVASSELQKTEPAKTPDQRRTASALHRVRGMLHRSALPSPAELPRQSGDEAGAKTCYRTGPANTAHDNRTGCAHRIPQAIAKRIFTRNCKRPCMYANLGLFIDAQWLNGDSRRGEDVINPATEKPLAHLPHA